MPTPLEALQVSAARRRSQLGPSERYEPRLDERCMSLDSTRARLDGRDVKINEYDFPRSFSKGYMLSGTSPSFLSSLPALHPSRHWWFSASPGSRLQGSQRHPVRMRNRSGALRCFACGGWWTLRTKPEKIRASVSYPRIADRTNLMNQ